MDHIPHRVLVRLHQPRDHRHPFAAGRGNSIIARR
jgi:hypothetical protein